MTKAILVRSGESEFLIETDESVSLPEGLSVAVSRPEVSASDFEDVVDLGRVGRDFDDVKKLIVVCCNNLYEAIESIPAPEKVSIEFGVKLAGETGFPMLTKASGEANFKISVEWKRQVTPPTVGG